MWILPFCFYALLFVPLPPWNCSPSRLKSVDELDKTSEKLMCNFSQFGERIMYQPTQYIYVLEPLPSPQPNTPQPVITLHPPTPVSVNSIRPLPQTPARFSPRASLSGITSTALPQPCSFCLRRAEGIFFQPPTVTEVVSKLKRAVMAPYCGGAWHEQGRMEACVRRTCLRTKTVFETSCR